MKVAFDPAFPTCPARTLDGPAPPASHYWLCVTHGSDSMCSEGDKKLNRELSRR